MPLNKPTLDPNVLAFAVRAEIERSGGMLDAVEPALNVINSGVKRASLLIPHNEDLT